MNNVVRMLLISLAAITISENVVAQDDEARQQSGLPTYIGNRPGTNSLPGTDATLSGSLTIQGLDESGKVPTFTVVVLANGSIVARQRVQNRGGFSFNNVPRQNVSVIVEADGLEITNYQLGVMNPPPMSNRQDIILTWIQVGQTIKRRNEVLSVRNSYQRTDANQKLFDKALIASKDKKVDPALKLFKQLLDTDPNDFVAWTEFGNLYFMGKKYSEGEEAYNKALELRVDFGPALLNLGKLFLIQKKYDASIETLLRALNLTPNSPDVNQFLGEAYLQAKKGSKAVTYLNKAIEFAPVEMAELHLRLATLYNGANLKDRAVVEYKLFLSKAPNHPEKARIEKYIKENSPK